MAIDYGSSNFATIVIEGHPTSYIIDGRGVKMLLWKLFKKKSKLQSRLDNLKKKNLPYYNLEKKLHKIQKRINNIIRDFSHKASSKIKELALMFKVTKIVIGSVQEVKNQKSDLPAKVNQFFNHLPHGKVSNQLMYKLEPHNIEVQLVEESYTSKTDSCDPNTRVIEDVQIGNGKRIKRGLFYSPCYGLINADVNGARNIIRKVKETFYDLITGLKQTIRIRIYNFQKSISESLFSMYKESFPFKDFALPARSFILVGVDSFALRRFKPPFILLESI